MICPRCTVAEVGDSGHCALCGFSPSTSVILQQSVIDEVQEVVQESTANRFRIEALLRLGERSLVYLAHEVARDRLVALKVIPVPGGVPRHLAQAFERQTALAQSLRHAHIVTVHDFGTTSTFLWYTLDHVQGQSLGDLLREGGPLSVELCLGITDQIASALDHAHRCGVAHGNLKPSNIFLDDRWVRVADFAIREAFDRHGASGAAGPSLRLPEYMAPEQFHARTAVASADQYALAVIVYQCLTGTLPFIGDSFEEVARRQTRDAAPLLADACPDLPATVADAVHRALSKQPVGRYPSVLDFVTALGATAPPAENVALGRRPTTSQRKTAEPPVLVVEPETPARVWRWKLALLALLTVGGGAGYALRDWIASLWRAEAVFSGDAAAAGLAAPITAPTAGASRTAETTEVPGLGTAAPAVAPPGGQSTNLQTPVGQRVTGIAAPAPVATLLVSASPWGQLFIDGVLVGNTPKANIPLRPGRRLVRITREGYEPFEREVMVEPGQVIRLTGIVLQPRGS
jgi:serine/threonine-protein kinase